MLHKGLEPEAREVSHQQPLCGSVARICRQTQSPASALFVSIPYQTHKRSEVIIIMKDDAAAIAPVQDIVNKPNS